MDPDHDPLILLRSLTMELLTLLGDTEGALPRNGSYRHRLVRAHALALADELAALSEAPRTSPGAPTASMND